MTLWRVFLIVGVLVGGAFVFVGILSEPVNRPLWVIGGALPLLALIVGLVVDRARRRRKETRPTQEATC